ncbi:hypothetical protein ACJX0J_033019, partial [Zea mays]
FILMDIQLQLLKRETDSKKVSNEFRVVEILDLLGLTLGLLHYEKKKKLYNQEQVLWNYFEFVTKFTHMVIRQHNHQVVGIAIAIYEWMDESIILLALAAMSSFFGCHRSDYLFGICLDTVSVSGSEHSFASDDGHTSNDVSDI